MHNSAIYEGKSNKIKKEKVRSPLSMVSFSDSSTCRKSFSGETSFCLRSFAKQVESKEERRTFFVTMSPKMVSDEGSRRFWPSSSSVVKNGRLRTVTVDTEDVDDLNDLVDRYGVGMQEE